MGKEGDTEGSTYHCEHHMQGHVGTKRALYEARWQRLSTADTSLSTKDIPWLGNNEDDSKAVALFGISGTAQIKQRLKLELMRWHPDKFQGRFGHRLRPDCKAEVLERVKQTSQMLNSLLHS